VFGLLQVGIMKSSFDKLKLLLGVEWCHKMTGSDKTDQKQDRSSDQIKGIR